MKKKIIIKQKKMPNNLYNNYLNKDKLLILVKKNRKNNDHPV